MQDIFQSKVERVELETGLYIIASPIGNLKDISLRGLEVLKSLDIIFCEDTRVTSALLSHFNISGKKLYTYNNYSDHDVRETITDIITKDKVPVGLISDAGTPLISDPGYKLVSLCTKLKIKVIPIPGPCAIITALSASGISSDKFMFYGFLSSKKTEKHEQLQEILNNRHTTICYETANRLLTSLTDIVEIDPDRKICVARELTKLHEEIISDTAQNILNYFNNNPDKLRGEIVLLIEKNTKTLELDLIIDNDTIKKYLKFLRPKDCASLLSEISGVNKKNIYNNIIKLTSGK